MSGRQRDAAYPEGERSFELLKGGWLLPFLLVLSVGSAISLCAFAISYKVEADRRGHLFNEIVSPLLQRFPSMMADRVAELDSTARFFASSDDVDRGEFENFVSPILRSRHDVLIIAWLPFVSEAQRANFERKLRGQGFADFKIYEKLADGSNVPAATTSSHFPYLYAWPLEGNAAILGYDAWSEPSRRSLMEAARDAGACVASGGMTLAGEVIFGGSQGMLICAPVYQKGAIVQTLEQRRGALRGFIVMALQPATLLKDLGWRELLKKADISISESSPFPEKPDVKSFWGGALSSSLDFSVAGRSFTIACKSKPAFFEENRIVVPWLILAIGVVISALVAMVFAFRELQLDFLRKALRKAKTPLELREASSIRMKIVVAVAFAMALMLAWFLLWTHRELSTVGRSVSAQTANQMLGLWRNLAARDVDDLREAFATALSDPELAKAWASKKRESILSAVLEFNAKARLSQPGDALAVIGLDRRCLVRTDKSGSYGELAESRMLAETVRTGRTLCGLDMDPDGSVKIRLTAFFAPGGSGSQPLGFLMFTRDASSYPEEARRIAGCELYLALFKKNIDERLWRSSSRELGSALFSWDDFGDFLPSGYGSLPSRAIFASAGELSASGWNSVAQIASGSDSWFCSSAPLEDYAGREIGRLVVLRDASLELRAQRKTLAMSLAGAGALAVILVLAISGLAGSMEKRLLSSVLARQKEEEELHFLQERLASTLHSIGDAVMHIANGRMA